MHIFKYTKWVLLYTSVSLLFSCKEDAEILPPVIHNLVFKYHFDSNQERLDNFGQPDNSFPVGQAAQSPSSVKMSSNYIELLPDSLTQLGDGEIIYKGTETTLGGANAIDFSKSVIAGEGSEFFSIPLNQIKAGTYKWLNISPAYQNYTVEIQDSGVDYSATISSFTGYNTYITNLKPKNKTISINANRLQGFYALEFNAYGSDSVITGQAPYTTVPNPLYATSPHPPGSSVITGVFDTLLTITGNEKKDIVITVSFSINNSVQWTDPGGNNVYEPATDTLVNLGIRGVIPQVQY